MIREICLSGETLTDDQNWKDDPSRDISLKEYAKAANILGTEIIAPEEATALKENAVYSSLYKHSFTILAHHQITSDSSLEQVVKCLSQEVAREKAKSTFNNFDIKKKEEEKKEYSLLERYYYGIIPHSTHLSIDTHREGGADISGHFILTPEHMKRLHAHNLDLVAFDENEYFKDQNLFNIFLDIYKEAPENIQKNIVVRIKESVRDGLSDRHVPYREKAEEKMIQIIEATKGDITDYLPLQFFIENQRVLKKALERTSSSKAVEFSPTLIQFCNIHADSSEIDSELGSQISSLLGAVTEIDLQRRHLFSDMYKKKDTVELTIDKLYEMFDASERRTWARSGLGFTLPIIKAENDSLRVQYVPADSAVGKDINEFIATQLPRETANPEYITANLLINIFCNQYNYRVKLEGADVKSAHDVLLKIDEKLKEILESGEYEEVARKTKRILESVGITNPHQLVKEQSFEDRKGIKFTFPGNDVYVLPFQQEEYPLCISYGTSDTALMNESVVKINTFGKVVDPTIKEVYNTLVEHLGKKGLAGLNDQERKYVRAFNNPLQKNLPLLAILWNMGLVRLDEQGLQNAIAQVEEDLIAANGDQSPQNPVVKNNLIINSTSKNFVMGSWYAQLCAYETLANGLQKGVYGHNLRELVSYKFSGIDMRFPVKHGLQIFKPVNDDPVVNELYQRLSQPRDMVTEQ